jgi:GAF domain-containing protein
MEKGKAMRRLLKNLFTVNYPYTNPIDRQRANALLVILWLFMILVPAVALIPNLLGLQELALLDNVYYLLVPVITILISILMLVFVQTGNLRLAARTFVFFHLVSIVPLFVNGLYQPVVIVYLIPLVAAGVLLSRRGMLFTLACILVMLAAATAIQYQLDEVLTIFPAQRVLSDGLVVIITISVIMLYLVLFNGNTNVTVRDSLGGTNQLQWVSEFSEQIAQAKDEPDLMRVILNLLRERFKYDFVQIYLLNEQDILTPRASTGLGGQAIIDDKNIYALNDATAISIAARTREHVLVTQQDYPNRRSHLMPSTRAGVVVPLISRERVMGVMDIQNDQPITFYRTTLTILKLLGIEIGNALYHLEHVQVLQRKLNEQEEVSTSLRLQLLKRERRSLQGVSTVWDRYLQRRGQDSFGFDVHRDVDLPTPANDMPDVMRPALQFGELHVTSELDEQVISLPIRIGEQTLGAMSFAVPQDQPLSQRQIDLAQSVADRLALALDNTRLLEQTQAQALRERKANEAGNLLISANNVNTLLELAAETFNNALGAIFTRIYLQPESTPESNGALSNGHNSDSEYDDSPTR